jgi:hypothetical protein
MLDQEDLKWIATSSTELNAIVQQISRYTDLARRHKGEYDYLNLLGERVELASRAAQALFDRVTSKILEGSYVKAKRKGKSNLRLFLRRRLRCRHLKVAATYQ